MPNTCSTPSALRHSMMASTARMLLLPAVPGPNIRCYQGFSRRPTPDCELARLVRVLAFEEAFLARQGFSLGLGIRQIGAAARADLHVDRHHLRAFRAAPHAHARTALVGGDERGDRAQERKAKADEKPKEERVALDLRDRYGRESEEEEDDD